MSTLFSKSHHRRRTKKRKAEDEEDEEGQTHAIKQVVSQDDNETNQNINNNNNKRNKTSQTTQPKLPSWVGFDELGLADPLVETCSALGFKKPTPVQRQIIPYLIQERYEHVLALAETGSGKTAAFCLPILHHLSVDPYGIYAVIISPTRELAKQIHQQVLALGSSYNVTSSLVVGGLDMVRQSCELDRKPHFVVATPGRLGELLRGPNPPNLKYVKYLILDEADRLLAANSGFERDVAELLLHCNGNKKRKTKCQTLLFSATMTRSLESIEEIAGAGKGRLPLRKFIIRGDNYNNNSSNMKKAKKETSQEEEYDEESKGSSEGSEEESDDDDDDNDEENENESDEDGEEEALTPTIPAGLKQEYIFMPSRVRDAYLLTAIRTFMYNGGRVTKSSKKRKQQSNSRTGDNDDDHDDDDENNTVGKARSAIIFVSTCERAALVSEILTQVGIENVALYSILSQNRRLASLMKFKSQHVRVLVATDVASRGLDIPSVDLIINSELPRNSISYIHRIGRTARAGRRGYAVSLVGENDISLIQSIESKMNCTLGKCSQVTDENAIQLLNVITKASRLAKMKLLDIGFDELLKKFKERKVRANKERQRIERALRKKQNNKK